MEVEEVLRRLGGVVTRADLVDATSRSDTDTALTSGRILAVGRGRYVLPHTADDLKRAHSLHGVLSHESAALHHGWGVLRSPSEPWVTVPRGRNVPAVRGRGVRIHRATLHVDDVVGSLTSQSRTVADCLRKLDLPSALAVADSALRAGRSPHWLLRIAEEVRGPGAKQARRVAREATDLAANPFESGLRGIALDVRGLQMRPQVELWAGSEFLGRPDLVDEDLRIVAEADSFRWHGGRADLVKDARRYNRFVVHGWMVLRFTWEDVVLAPAEVAGILEAAVQQRSH